MRSPIVVPQVGAASCLLNAWFVKPGEYLYSGDRVVEMLLDGATFDISSPATGTLAQQVMHPGQPLSAGQVVGYIDAEDD